MTKMDEFRDCEPNTQSAGLGHEMLFGRLGELRGILLSLHFGGMQFATKKACQSHVDHKCKSEASGRLRVLDMVGISFSELDQGVLYGPGRHERNEIVWWKHKDMELIQEDAGDGDTCVRRI